MPSPPDRVGEGDYKYSPREYL